ncbi:unnamed protein product [Rotaria sp. Silwood1]|nr:unnamed protein product [Rotaria sp. Silwood1]CAF3607202.1 unnamed protein product [Rotaria sp. Silwood1]
MSIVEVNGAGNPHPDELIQTSHTPKRNWKKTADFNIGVDQHPSKLSDNRQETAKVSTAVTTTSSYSNISHQFKKSSNDSSNRLRRESP